MRFVNRSDYSTILKINQELINKVIDTPVIIYKIQVDKTKENIYGEGTKKTYFRGVAVPCLVDRQMTAPNAEIGTIDIEQKASFAFLRQELQNRNVYPEPGDIIEFDRQYYELENTNEVQMFVGQTEYNVQVYCDTHLMRRVPSQLESPTQYE
jgi:hypothetical protein